MSHKKEAKTPNNKPSNKYYSPTVVLRELKDLETLYNTTSLSDAAYDRLKKQILAKLERV